MPRYREVLLHAGLSKTGSTSIQDACRKLAGELANAGWHYPEFTAGSHRFLYHSIPLTVACTAAPGRYGLGLARRFGDTREAVMAACRQGLAELLDNPQQERLVLSSELLESWSESDLGVIRERLAGACGTLRVVVFLRSPESSLESSLQERVKAGAVLEPEQIAGRTRAKYERLRRVFGGALEVLDYHAALAEGGVVAPFLRCLGVPAALAAQLPPVSSNPRLSLQAFTLLRWLNEQRQFTLPPALLARERQRLARLPGSPFRLPGLAGSALQRELQAEGRWFEQELGWTLPRQPAPDRGEAWPQLTLAALPALLSGLESEEVRGLLLQRLASELPGAAAAALRREVAGSP